MRGIDVSNHQNDIDIFKIACDFVIVKATEGKTYVSPVLDKQAQASLDTGKKLGLYHYINGKSSPAEEMANFYDAYKAYANHAIVALDWEPYTNNAWGNDAYLNDCVKEWLKLCEVVPFIYASKAMFPHAVANAHSCGKWIAQYANDLKTTWQDTPWNESAYSCEIRQYTSKGSILGYNGLLDLDKAYITPQEWDKWTAGTPIIVVAPDHTVFERFAQRVIKGEFGNGNARRRDAIYRLVRQEVNRLYQAKSALDADAREVAQMVRAGAFGNGHTARARKIYAEVRKCVNKML